MEDNKKHSPLENFSPGQVFGLGIVGGILVLCTIGFFIMLSMFLSDDNSFAKANNPSPTPNVPAAPAAAGGPVEVAKVTKDDHVRGNEKADITIVEYSDFECPFCSRFHDTMNQVIDTYGDDVKWVYRHFPLESIHPNARTASLASECAADQGKFWEFADATIAAQPSGLSNAVYNRIAGEIGLNMGEFEDCVSSREFDQDVQDDINSGGKAGARGTPYSILITEDGDTQVINGAQPFTAVEAIIKQYVN